MASGFREGGGSGNGLSAKTLHICGKDDKICVTCFSVFLVQTKGSEGMKCLVKPLEQGQILEVEVCLWFGPYPVSVTWLPGDTTPHYIIFYRDRGQELEWLQDFRKVGGLVMGYLLKHCTFAVKMTKYVYRFFSVFGPN